MAEYIEREEAIKVVSKNDFDGHATWAIKAIPIADVVELPETGIGDLSDGYHTFNGLYEQRMILFAALAKAYKDRAWKSYRHEDGEYCFGGGWFIVGIDTPEGTYTYHYENKYWEMFDGHRTGTGIPNGEKYANYCPNCGAKMIGGDDDV